ncbi:MAG: biotin carboxyl carrier domain-containing protein [Chthonomonadaceae bacterium]|nr:biotin carboxyl carrier domain-containing protein [Chthonomonadaceae bacterium]
MREFHLAEATLQGEDWKIALRRGRRSDAPTGDLGQPLLLDFEPHAPVAAPEPQAPTGTPVNSPMNGIFYATPSPNTPPFVREGDTVSAGQVVGLIEAMKVFNEITAPLSGTVRKVLVESGQLVQPGEPLMILE